MRNDANCCHSLYGERTSPDKKAPERFFAPAQDSFFLFDVYLRCGGFVLLLLLVDAANAAAGAASAVAAVAGQTALVFDEVPDGQNEDEDDDRTDDDAAEVVLDESKHGRSPTYSISPLFLR